MQPPAHGRPKRSHKPPARFSISDPSLLPSSPASSITLSTKTQCNLCNRAVGDQDKALCCDGCDQWQHQKCLKMKIRDFRKLGAANRDWLCAPCKDQKERAEYRGEYRSIPSSSEDEEQESPLQSEEITPHSPQTPSTPVYGLSQRGKTFMLTPATIPTPLTPTSQRRKLPIPPHQEHPEGLG